MTSPALIEPEERGDPISALRWTLKSTYALADELTALGHPVSSSVVGHILAEQGFSLRGNAKVLEGSSDRDRDAQFRHINDLSARFLAAGDPVISVDGKKKERIGLFANAGSTWRPRGRPVKVADHDFPDEHLGKVAPFGIYDVGRNTGWVSVGLDHETAQFALEAIRRWWRQEGSVEYPEARRILIVADAGGANAANSRLFKTALAALALETGLEIQVRHLPRGTSKWNKIEHRLFSHITMNWRGRPLTSIEVVLASIRATTTRTGLSVKAQLDTNTYPTGLKVSDQQFAALPLTGHHWRPDLNYTLRPEPYTFDPRQRTAIDQPNPRVEHYCHPAVTGRTAQDWNDLVAQLVPLHQARRDAIIAHNHAHRPSPYPPRAPRTALSIPDQLLATFLRQRHHMPATAIATLFNTSSQTIYNATRAISELLTTTGHPIHALPHKLATLDDLDKLASTAGINPTTPAQPA